MSDTTLISLRIPNDLLGVLDRLAKDERRSRAQIITDRLYDYLDEEGQFKSPSKDLAKALDEQASIRPVTLGHHPRCKCTICVKPHAD